MGRCVEPLVVAIGVALGCAFARCCRANLQADHRADEFAIEGVAELHGCDEDVALQALPGRRAELADPLVLEDRQGRQQDEQRQADERRARWLSDPHGPKCNTHGITVNH